MRPPPVPMLTRILLARLFIVAVGLALLSTLLVGCDDSDPAPKPSTSVNLMDPAVWEVGPIIKGENKSKGVPLHPVATPDGWAIDIPHPTPAAGHVHYITAPYGPLAGKSRITMRYRVELAEGAEIMPICCTDQPSYKGMLTPFFQRRGDNWTGSGEFETYRWWGTFATQTPIPAGEHEIVAPLDAKWTAVQVSSSETNPSGFAGALADTGRVGFCLGGGDSYCHGVYATGPARIVVTGFAVE